MTACDITAFPSCRGTSLCCCVWLQVHRDLGSCATQCERAFWRHCEASPAPEGQQGEEREASGIPKTEREHLQESQAVLGQNSCQEQQEYGLQTKVQVLPWPIGTLRTLDSARACGILWTLSNCRGTIHQSIYIRLGYQRTLVHSCDCDDTCWHKNSTVHGNISLFLSVVLKEKCRPEWPKVMLGSVLEHTHRFSSRFQIIV